MISEDAGFVPANRQRPLANGGDGRGPGEAKPFDPDQSRDEHGRWPRARFPNSGRDLRVLDATYTEIKRLAGGPKQDAHFDSSLFMINSDAPGKVRSFRGGRGLPG
jgi:hypothetical protein